MPKVKFRKARKDYPEHGIEKGDMYYHTSLKTGRGGIVKRSKTPFKPSELTTSPYKSQALAIGEAWEASSKDVDAAAEAGQSITDLGQECQDSYDNMPEGLQMGETGQMIEERASGCDSLACDIETLVGDWQQSLDEIKELETEMTELEQERSGLTDGTDDVADLERLEEIAERIQEIQDALSDAEENCVGCKNDITEKLGDLPE